MAGEFEIAIVQYITDSGRIFSFSQRRTNALAVGNLLLAVRGVQGVPERWKLRYIRIQCIQRGKLYTRRVFIGNVNNPLFRGDVGFVKIDGTVWRVVDRRGEYSRGPKLSGD